MGVLKNLTEEYFGDIIRDEDFIDVEVHSELNFRYKFYDVYGEIHNDNFYNNDDDGYILEKIDTDERKGLAIISTTCVILIEELKNDKYIGEGFYIVAEDDKLDDVYGKFYTILTKINKGINWKIGEYKDSYCKIEINKQDIPVEISKYINKCLRLKLIK